ncbi:MAG TPA: discoidin domain-containing protein [Polyangiaceae bacterium]|nr:discoidin domain-containing protein [Polyangiaceae bacterium]
MTHGVDPSQRRRTGALALSSGGARYRDERVLQARLFTSILGAALALGCSIYDDVPMTPEGGPTTGGRGGSTAGNGGLGGQSGTRAEAGATDVTGSGAGGTQSEGGTGGQGGSGGSGISDGAAGAGGGSSGASGSGGFGGSGGTQDEGGFSDGRGGGSSGGTDAGSSDGSSGGSSGGTDGGSSGGMDGGSAGGNVDAADAPWDGLRQDAADSDADACTPETDVAFCMRVAKNCGTVNGTNNCGAAVSVGCGSCVAPQTCGGAGQPNLCGSPTDVATGGTVSSSSPGVSPEDMTKAFDQNNSTKWFAGDAVSKGWIGYQFASGITRTVTSYSLTSANDMPTRDPADWQLLGSHDGVTWLTVDTRAGETFASRFQTKSYSCAMPMAYERYRLNVTANSGAPALQLAELRLLGY